MRPTALIAVVTLASVGVGSALFIESAIEREPPRTATVASRPLRLEGFRHARGAGEIEIDISGRSLAVAVVTTEVQPRDLAPLLRRAADDPGCRRGATGAEGRVRLRLAEEAYNHATLVVFVDRGNPPAVLGYVELLRQSERLLRARFDFEKPGGYTILGRTSIDLPTGDAPALLQRAWSRPLTRSYPDLAPYRTNRNHAGAIDEAVALVRFLWSKPLRLGPNADRSPFELGPLQRLERLRSGSWSTQCADLRYLFVNLAAASPRIPKARYVDLLQYCPPFPDLIPNSHAVAEIQVSDEEGWVLVDPWHGCLFMLDGRPLSAADMAALTGADRARVKTMACTPRRLSPLEHPPGPPDGIILEDGYFAYFGCLTYGPEETAATISAGGP